MSSMENKQGSFHILENYANYRFKDIDIVLFDRTFKMIPTH